MHKKGIQMLNITTDPHCLHEKKRNQNCQLFTMTATKMTTTIFEEEIRKLLHCTYYRIPFKLLADHAVILKDNIMTNGRYVITINTVKSPFAAALATLMGADMLKHLLARLPNPIFFRVGIQPQGEHVIGLASEMGSPVFLFSYLTPPPPKYEHAHKMCLCVCVCGGGGDYKSLV